LGIGARAFIKKTSFRARKEKDKKDLESERDSFYRLFIL
jgi:hypothetical protein